MVQSVFNKHRLLNSTIMGSIAGSLLITSLGGAANAGEISNAFQSLVSPTRVTEKVSLKDLGIDEALSLASSSASREIYLPVPANIALENPAIAVNGDYIRADGGRTTYTLALDGNVVAARGLTEDAGKTNIAIGVDGSPRPSGFVRMGINWSSAIGEQLCQDDRAIGNVLKISPDSYLEYSYDPSQIKTVADVWSALPRKVVLLVSSDAPGTQSYDAAWRIGVALVRAGKEVEVVAAPKVGDTVNTAGLQIPTELSSVPSVAVLSRGGKVTLANEAQAGAWLLLNSGGKKANIAIADEALTTPLKGAIAALGQELTTADPETQTVLDAFSENTNSLLAPVEPKSLTVRSFAGRPVIAVAPDAATNAASIFDSLWRRSTQASRLILNTVSKPENNADSVSLGALNQASSTIDVVARGDWTTTFDLGDGLVAGKVPSGLDIKVSAAPGATQTLPVASVFLNDYLLGARQLDADGRPELISVDVPAYALLPRNTVRVQFQRQPSSGSCSEIPQAYPVAVLPDSTMRLREAGTAEDFGTLISHLAGESVVLADENWGKTATESLPVLIDVAAASGISPAMAEFKFVANSATVTPEKPFLAFDLPVAGGVDSVKVSGDRLSIADRKGNVFYDVAGLSDVGVLQAVTKGSEPGISYNSVGTGPKFNKAFVLPRGDIAVVGDQGAIASVNSAGTPTYLSAGASGDGRGGTLTMEKLLNPSNWLNNLTWLLTSGLIVAFLLVFVLAHLARKRAKND
ncbi:cellulose biosynthesis cyclic di-GMP-binding regulatory protein BcsB [Brucella sp. BE17]|uniref:cellulose biosynthesis cyclic di-GMP-binding regulatory protein BcsB n=1 Tax=Brucella sp. BE17 TaxID=3142977 RepID=UPI0031BB1962